MLCYVCRTFLEVRGYPSCYWYGGGTHLPSASSHVRPGARSRLRGQTVMYLTIAYMCCATFSYCPSLALDSSPDA
ncbi:hypothetical protein BD309DRAFT_953620 [Dichomitus squalens]|nr:hypothetical protein BD309DRAFT_953620 [Dichomitus squalens]